MVIPKAQTTMDTAPQAKVAHTVAQLQVHNTSPQASSMEAVVIVHQHLLSTAPRHMAAQEVATALLNPHHNTDKAKVKAKVTAKARLLIQANPTSNHNTALPPTAKAPLHPSPNMATLHLHRKHPTAAATLLTTATALRLPNKAQDPTTPRPLPTPMVNNLLPAAMDPTPQAHHQVVTAKVRPDLRTRRLRDLANMVRDKGDMAKVRQVVIRRIVALAPEDLVAMVRVKGRRRVGIRIRVRVVVDSRVDMEEGKGRRSRVGSVSALL